MLAICLALQTACSQAKLDSSLTEQYGGNEPEAQMEFWHRMAERPVTTNDEAFHALLLYLDGEDASADYAGRVGTLRERKLLPDGFDRPANEAVKRGTMAVAIARTLDIEGGVMMRLLGATPRYATRELQYMNLFPPSSPHQTFTGAEFLGVMGRFEDYQRANPRALKAEQLQ